MDVTRSDIRDFIRILFVCICWYIVSSSNGVLGKTILSQFPYPMTVTMVQLTSIALWSPPLLKVLGVRKYESTTWSYHLKMLFPLAFAKFLSSVLAHVSVWKVPVHYAHTVKASMPLFTVLLTRLLFGVRHSWVVYFSLLPIVLGVAIATVTEISFDIVGLLSALMATAGFAIITVYSKKALKDTGMHHLRLLHKLGSMAAIMFLPIWLLVDAPKIPGELNTDVITLLVIDGALHWMQNLLAFTLLKLVTPLAYAVANVTKRIAVITVSLLLLKNPVTWTNMGGMMMAILGVFCYNRAKYRENLEMKTLPTSLPKKQAPSLWDNHLTFDSKVTVTSPSNYFIGGMNRNH